jgi:hypothetical protein
MCASLHNFAIVNIKLAQDLKESDENDRLAFHYLQQSCWMFDFLRTLTA